MFKWLWELIDRLFDSNPKSSVSRGRFPDGRMYEISDSGGMRIVLEDEQTRRIVNDSIKKFHEDFKKSQPHMWDEDGKFIGGYLK